MPHMPDYKCTPPKGGGGRVLWIIVLVVLVVAGIKAADFIAEYLGYIMIALAVIAGIAVARLTYHVVTALRAKTWKEEEGNTISLDYMIQRQAYYGGRFPLDGGTVIKGQVLPPDRVSRYPTELMRRYETGHAWEMRQARKHDAEYPDVSGGGVPYPEDDD